MLMSRMSSGEKSSGLPCLAQTVQYTYVRKKALEIKSAADVEPVLPKQCKLPR